MTNTNLIAEVMLKGLIPIENISGGSGAETWVVKDKDNNFFVRKFGVDKIGDKLKLQTKWLRENSKQLTCPQILKEATINNCYYYDMNYLNPSDTIFNVLKNKTSSNSLSLILDSLKNFFNLLNEFKVIPNTEDRKKYLNEKLFNNLEVLSQKNRDFFQLINAKEIIINEVAYMGFAQVIENQFVKKAIDEIEKESLFKFGHGDLTLSNILLQDKTIYYIDPNPTFNFISFNQEFSKILQSTLIQYELVDQLNVRLILSNNTNINYQTSQRINFDNLNQDLFKLFNVNNQGMDSVLLHLAIHLIRILPYVKIENTYKTYFYFAESIKLLNKIATQNYTFHH